MSNMFVSLTHSLTSPHLTSLTHAYCFFPMFSIFSLANDLSHSDDLTKVFKDTGTKFVFTVPDLLPKVKDALADHPAIKVRAVTVWLFFGRHGIVVFFGTYTK